MGKVVDSSIFGDAVNSRGRSSSLARAAATAADEQTVRWSRSPAISTLSLAGWDPTGSRITLLSHPSSSAGDTGSGYDVTPSPTSDFRCPRTPPELRTPSTEGNVTTGNEADGNNEAFSLERKRKRKWKGSLTAGPSNPIGRQQPYQRLDDDDE